MTKFILSVAVFVFALSFTARSQYYTFGSDYMCATDTTGIMDEAQKRISSSLKALMDAGNVYGFDVNSHEHTNDDGPDSVHFLVMMFARDQSEFDANTKLWESENAETLKVLSERCSPRHDDKFGEQTSYLPLIKDARAAVYSVDHIDEKPDPGIQYKIVIDFTAYQEVPGEEGHKFDPKGTNWGLQRIGRLINLHIGAGIPAENINIVAAVHGMSSHSFFTNETYRKAYKMDNPNLDLISELSEAGVKFLLCGQSLGSTKKEDLVPEAKITLTAQTTLSEYQMKGYALMDYSNE